MFAIVNKSPRVVLCRLNSGRELNLGPGERLEVSDAEVRDNRWLEKLTLRGLIDVVSIAGAPVPAPRRSATRSASHRAPAAR